MFPHVESWFVVVINNSTYGERNAFLSDRAQLNKYDYPQIPRFNTKGRNLIIVIFLKEKPTESECDKESVCLLLKRSFLFE